MGVMCDQIWKIREFFARCFGYALVAGASLSLVLLPPPCCLLPPPSPPLPSSLLPPTLSS